MLFEKEDFFFFLTDSEGAFKAVTLVTQTEFDQSGPHFFKKGKGLVSQRWQLSIPFYFLHVICMRNGKASCFQYVRVCEPAFENEDEGTKRSGIRSRNFKAHVWHALLTCNSLCSENLLKTRYAS